MIYFKKIGVKKANKNGVKKQTKWWKKMVQKMGAKKSKTLV